MLPHSTLLLTVVFASAAGLAGGEPIEPPPPLAAPGDAPPQVGNPPPVQTTLPALGPSPAYVERLRLHLHAAVAEEHAARVRGAWALGGLGLAFGFVALSASRVDSGNSAGATQVGAGCGAIFALSVAVIGGFGHTELEGAAEQLDKADLSRPEAAELAVHQAEAAFAKAHEPVGLPGKLVGLTLSLGLGAYGVFYYLDASSSPSKRGIALFELAVGALGAGQAIGSLVVDSGMTSRWDLYDAERKRDPVQLSVAPIAGGAVVSLGGPLP